MSAATAVEAPVASTQEAMGRLVAAKGKAAGDIAYAEVPVSNRLVEFFRSLPDRIRAAGRRVVDALHLQGAVDTAKLWAHKGAGFFRQVWHYVGDLFHPFAIGMDVLSTGGRKMLGWVARQIGRAVRFVTAPLRWVGRKAVALVRKTSWGRTVTDKVTSWYRRAKAKAVEYKIRVVAWLDRHDNHWLMHVARNALYFLFLRRLAFKHYATARARAAYTMTFSGAYAGYSAYSYQKRNKEAAELATKGPQAKAEGATVPEAKAAPAPELVAVSSKVDLSTYADGDAVCVVDEHGQARMLEAMVDAAGVVTDLVDAEGTRYPVTLPASAEVAGDESVEAPEPKGGHNHQAAPRANANRNRNKSRR